MNVVRILYSGALVSAVASAALGADLYFTYQSMEEYSPPSAKRGKPSAGVPAKNAKKIDYSIIARRNLFSSIPLGRSAARRRALESKSRKAARSRVPPVKPKAVKAAAPPLKLKLVGTSVGPGGRKFAILKREGSSRQTIHRLGDRVHGAVTQGVKRGEVRIGLGGRTHILRIFEEDAKGTPKPEKPPAGEKSPKNVLPPRPQPLNELEEVSLGERLERLAKRKGGLLGQIRVMPYQNNAEETGVRLLPKGRGELLRLIGMRPGDVLLRVDGSPVEDREALGEALRQILENRGATLQFLWGEKRRSRMFRY